jgi:death-on-curing protein
MFIFVVTPGWSNPGILAQPVRALSLGEIGVDRLIAIHGGLAGVRDDALLQSSLARARQHHAYESSDVVTLAALYTAGIVRNHPFIDGNKRTGFVAAILFLELNGYRFNASEESAARAIEVLAAGTLDETDYAVFLKSATTRPKRTRRRAG